MKTNDLRFEISDSQQHLLRTLIGPPSEAVTEYRKWIDSVNIDNYIDAGSYALIPALYKRLKELGYSDNNIPRYLGIYKKSLYKNGMHFNNLKKLAMEFNRQGVPLTAIKGTAYTLKYYKDLGLRSMNDLDIVVPVESLEASIGIMNSVGFESDCGYDILSNYKIRHSFEFSNSSGWEVDLHWMSENEKDIFLSFENEVVDFRGTRIQLLTKESSISFLLTHGSMDIDNVNIRWFYDLYTIIRNEPDVDWNHIVEKLKGTDRELATKIMLDAFNSISDIKVPDHVLNKLYELGNTKIGRKFARIKLQPGKHFWNKLGFFFYNRQYKHIFIVKRLLLFPRHVLRMSQYKTYGDISKAFFRKYILRKTDRSA